MKQPSVQLCTVCGEMKIDGQIWFLVAESHWEDKLSILQWEDEISLRHGMYGACSPTHVEELVVHWMTTGSLDFPFAIGQDRLEQKPGSFLPVIREADTRGARHIGELCVHRESMTRVLQESPDLLQTILDELTDALNRETTGRTTQFESGSGLLTGPLRQM